jgi:hypothetical protein
VKEIRFFGKISGLKPSEPIRQPGPKKMKNEQRLIKSFKFYGKPLTKACKIKKENRAFLRNLTFKAAIQLKLKG